MTDAERMTELEIRYAHLEDFAQQLSDLVREQGDELQRLRTAVEQLVKRLQNDGPDAADAAVDAPPHY
ncbi:MAG: SlyX family protein [Myxococcales bacterium]|nr:SlyX family protein [Myxococcales bacterium]MCB9523697.1 SlyX family protein [Myxococcales bacterium]